MKEIEKLWNQHIAPHLECEEGRTLRGGDRVDQPQLRGRDIELAGPIRVAQDMVILCESFSGRTGRGVIILEEGVENFAIVARTVAKDIVIKKPPPAEPDRSESGHAGQEAPIGGNGGLGADGKDASLFHDADKGDPGGDGGLGGAGQRGGEAQLGLIGRDQGDAAVFAMSFEPGTTIEVELPGGQGGDAGDGGGGGRGGQGGTGGDGGEGGDNFFFEFKEGEAGGRGGRGGDGGVGGDGGNGENGGKGGEGGDFTIFFTDEAQLDNLSSVSTDLNGGAGGEGGLAGQGGKGGDSGKGGQGGDGGKGAAGDGAGGDDGNPGGFGSDGTVGVEGAKGIDGAFGIERKRKIGAAGFILAASAALDAEQAERVQGAIEELERA